MALPRFTKEQVERIVAGALDDCNNWKGTQSIYKVRLINLLRPRLNEPGMSDDQVEALVRAVTGNSIESHWENNQLRPAGESGQIEGSKPTSSTSFVAIESTVKSPTGSEPRCIGCRGALNHGYAMLYYCPNTNCDRHLLATFTMEQGIKEPASEAEQGQSAERSADTLHARMEREPWRIAQLTPEEYQQWKREREDSLDTLKCEGYDHYARAKIAQFKFNRVLTQEQMESLAATVRAWAREIV